MPEARFSLKEPKSVDKTLVYMFYSFNNQRLKYSTGEKIHPKFWNSTKQRAKETAQFPEYPEFNQRLNNIETAVNNCYRRLLNDSRIISPSVLREELTNELRTDELTSKQLTLIEWMEAEVELLKVNKKEGTIKVYRTLINHLKAYSSKYKVVLTFESIDLGFYETFRGYLQNEKKLVDNSCGKQIRTLKFFLNLATEKGINVNQAYRSRLFKTVEETVEHIYLTEDELTKMYEVDLSSKPSLDRVRDLFLIGCHTGLRFSDFTELKPENLQESNSGYVFNIKTNKTNEKVVVPVKSVVKKIWDKYGGLLPRKISNQKTNSFIKEVGKLAEIDSRVIIKHTRGKHIEEKICPKYELITTHTARRSFATNAYLAGIPAISIMKFTGHKTESSFLKYIKVTQERNAKLLSDHPFFK